MSDITPALEARRKNALDMTMTHNGVIRTRREIVEILVAAGAFITVHPKERRRLMRPDGCFIEEGRLTTTAMDYAEALIDERDAA